MHHNNWFIVHKNTYANHSGFTAVLHSCTDLDKCNIFFHIHIQGWPVLHIIITQSSDTHLRTLYNAADQNCQPSHFVAYLFLSSTVAWTWHGAARGLKFPATSLCLCSVLMNIVHFSPTGVRNYLKEALVNIITVHAEVQTTSTPLPHTSRVLSALLFIVNFSVSGLHSL